MEEKVIKMVSKKHWLATPCIVLIIISLIVAIIGIVNDSTAITILSFGLVICFLLSWVYLNSIYYEVEVRDTDIMVYYKSIGVEKCQIIKLDRIKKIERNRIWYVTTLVLYFTQGQLLYSKLSKIKFVNIETKISELMDLLQSKTNETDLISSNK